ncbi:ABC transporter substrate-binding protein [Nesterenkonia aerolata]|uniref:ABC transporter substrate-binding protein n=1 Tax=Nesterenkonia aerolata TaxID=3074079 RepID=A0ABU2DPY2_9MICC|nr:ABC transporter substrate-binding protein [Nesterenkonia sp. LY-0111]MDR8018420.1 ABC transporter substrate-binding protein [Nesterenkonia sp. LY-0111]
MRKTPIALTASLTALALGLSACGGGGDDEDSSEESSEAVTVEHNLGTTEIPAAEDGELDIVALGWSDAEVALALGHEPIAVMDWLGFGEENHGVGPWAADLVEGEPTVIERADGEIDYEEIQALNPDLILNVNSDYDEATYERLSEIAPTVAGPEGAENFNPGWENQTELIAQALGEAEAGEELVAETQDRIEEVASEHSDFEGVEAVTGSKFGEAYGLSASGDLRWDLMEDLGFTMYGPAADLAPEDDFYADVSQEQVDVFDAEVAVLFPIGYTLEDLEDDDLLSSLDVVSEDRAVLLDPEEDLVQAFSAGSPLSIEVVLDELPDRLQEAVDNGQE